MAEQLGNLKSNKRVLLIFWADGIGGAQLQGRLLQKKLAENGYVCEIFFVTKSIVPKSRIYLRVRQLTSIMKLLFIAPRYNIHLFYLYGSIKLQKLLSLHPFKSKK